MKIKKIFTISCALILLSFVLLIAATNYVLTSTPLQVCSRQTEPLVAHGATPEPVDQEIKCPFLKFVHPESNRLFSFSKEVENAGMAPLMSILVTMQVTWQQKGLWAVVRCEAPDIYNLESVPGVSHCDLYTRHIAQVRTQAEKMQVDGKLTLQDLVTIKQWIAAQEQVEIIEPSKIETALLFVRSGGDFESRQVATKDVLAVLEGRLPEYPGMVSFSTMSKARAMSNWD